MRPFTDTLLEIVGFTRADAKCFIRKYFQHAQHSAEKLISEVYRPSYFPFHSVFFKNGDKDFMELLKNPLNTLQLCVIFGDLEGSLPIDRMKLYVEIGRLFILRRYEKKNGLSNRGKDLLLVYKRELMILGEIAWDSLRKQEKMMITKGISRKVY